MDALTKLVEKQKGQITSEDALKTFTARGANINPNEEEKTFLKEDARTRTDFRFNPVKIRKNARLVTSYNVTSGCYEPNNRNILGAPDTIIKAEKYMVEK